MTRIDFVYFDAGGGHRAAATALKTIIEGQRRPWQVRMVNLQELLDPLDVFRKTTGIRLQDVYNRMLAKGWTLGAGQGLKFVHALIRMYHRPGVQLLERHWDSTQPDMVVSLVPNFNRALHQSLKGTLPHVPFCTILTDFADHPPHFWMVPQEQFLICGTPKAVEQAKTMGHAADKVFRVSGMVLRPKFYEPIHADRRAERIRLGLDPDRPTGLVLFGGQGSKKMVQIARKLSETQLILICGKNQKLQNQLSELKAKAPHFIEGFTSEIPYYMHLADFFIGKPGPGSISEAVAMKLPVIVERNAATLPQERYNADWVKEHNAGIVVESFSTIAMAVKRLLKDLPSYQESVAKIENRAVFEIPDIFEGMLRKNRPQPD
ncbi:MAG: galactosyldiacylglycerol synthase [Bryobacterales bacterium]|nr:galactosyldiacylglycerol synthase [Bryobacterales bacterium]MBV9399304.1 galactosyldiacylglycerol synthase [Bryobacterales bacterium]